MPSRLRQAVPARAHDVAPVRLAILPFEVDGPGDARALGVGLADSLITRLIRVRALGLRPTTAIRRYAGVQQDPIKVGRDLDVDYLLLGTARSRGDSYDFTLQLVRADNGMAVWGEPITVPHVQPLEVEQLIVDRITRALEVPIAENLRASVAHRDTTNAEAHLQYLTGRALMIQNGPPDRALQSFEAAVRLDPAYARAHAGVAHMLARKSWGHAESPQSAAQYRARAKAAAERALGLDANLAEAHESLSSIYRYSEAQWDKTIEEGRKALALDPTLAIPHHNMATAFYHLGLFSIQIRRASQAFRPTLTAARTHC